jgi:hypothetical protein
MCCFPLRCLKPCFQAINGVRQFVAKQALCRTFLLSRPFSQHTDVMPSHPIKMRGTRRLHCGLQLIQRGQG